MEMNENPHPEEPDSGNKADIEPEAEEKCLWELNPLVTSANKLDINNPANDVGEWYTNEELDLAYFSVFASDFVPSDTSTDVDDDPWSAIAALTSLHVSVKSSLMAYQGPVMHKDRYSWSQRTQRPKTNPFWKSRVQINDP